MRSVVSIAETVEHQELIDERSGFAVRQNATKHGTDEIPNLAKCFRRSNPQRCGMFGAPKDGTVGVVIELNEFRPPRNVHGISGTEKDADGNPQRLGPRRNGTETSRSPIL